MDPKMSVQEAAKILGVSPQAIFKKIKANDLNSQKSNRKAFFGQKTSKEIFNISFKQKTIVTQIVKGGTGKTAVTQAVAIRAALYGARVLCIDLDQQANLTQSFGLNVNSITSPIMINIVRGDASFKDGLIEIVEGISLLPSKIENALLEDFLKDDQPPIDEVYASFIDQVKSEYDLIIMDCPPALGRSVAAAALASDFVLSPVTPEQSSITGLDMTFNTLKEAFDSYGRILKLRIIQNKFDVRTNLSHQILVYLLQHPCYRDCMFKSYIRHSQEFPNSFYKKISIFDGFNFSQAREDIDVLTREILEIPELNKKAEVDFNYA